MGKVRINNSSKIWKKHSIYGYSKEYVKFQLDKMKLQQSERIEGLQSEIERAKLRNNELRILMEQLESSISAANPLETEMSSFILQKHYETTKKVLDTQVYLGASKLLKEEELQAKRIERDKIVSQLKEGLQMLHSTYSKMGGSI